MRWRSDYSSLHELVRIDPERAWPLVLKFVRNHPALAESQDLIEDLVYEHDDRFITRIEAAALDDPVIADVVMQAYVGGVATEGARMFADLRERLHARGDQPGP
jgi:hypothetical protein